MSHGRSQNERTRRRWSPARRSAGRTSCAPRNSRMMPRKNVGSDHMNRLKESAPTSIAVPPPPGRDQPQHHPEHDRERLRRQDQPQRVDQRLTEQVDHRPVAERIRDPEVAPRQRPEVREVLRVERVSAVEVQEDLLVQPEALARAPRPTSGFRRGSARPPWPDRPGSTRNSKKLKVMTTKMVTTAQPTFEAGSRRGRSCRQLGARADGRHRPPDRRSGAHAATRCRRRTRARRTLGSV